MKPQALDIQQLVSMYLNDELRLPEMQRKYVWTAPRVRDLMDSIYKDYPSGSILMWRVEQLPETRAPAITSEGGKSPFSEKLLLLDGQQRLTSLASVVTGKPIRVKEGDEIVEKHINLFFNLEHPDKFSPEVEDPNSGYVASEDDESKNMFFQVRTGKLSNLPNWISVTKLFTKGVGAILKELNVDYDDPKYEKYNKRLLQLYSRRENYVYPVQILPRELSYEEATDVFVRVNSLGSRLSGSDLALALVTSRWSGLVRLFEDFIARMAKAQFFLEEGFLIRCVKAVASGQSTFDGIGKIPVESLKSSWENVKKGLELVANFVRNNARVDTSAVIPSPYVFVPLVVYASRNNFSLKGHERKFLRWFYEASMWGRYARGQSETILDQDLRVLNSLDPGESLHKNLLQQIGRTEVKEEDLEGKNVNSSFFMMQYVLAVRNGARDWGSGLALSFTSIGKGHKITHDHIFPRSKITELLKKKYGDDKTRITSLVNDIANIALLSEKENPSKSNRLPREYLKRVKDSLGEDALTSQLIPLNENLWEMDRFEDFLVARRRLMQKAINDLMENTMKTNISVAPSTLELIKAGESEVSEFKSSLRWDYRTNSGNNLLALAIAKDISSFMNSQGGTVLIGVSDKGDILGLDKDFSTFEAEKKSRDGFELHLMQVLKKYLGVEPMKLIHAKFETVQGKEIARVSVERASNPVYVKSEGRTEFYVRMGNASHPLSVEETVRYIGSSWQTRLGVN